MWVGRTLEASCSPTCALPLETSTSKGGGTKRRLGCEWVRTKEGSSPRTHEKKGGSAPTFEPLLEGGGARGISDDRLERSGDRAPSAAHTKKGGGGFVSGRAEMGPPEVLEQVRNKASFGGIIVSSQAEVGAPGFVSTATRGPLLKCNGETSVGGPRKRRRRHRSLQGRGKGVKGESAPRGATKEAVQAEVEPKRIKVARSGGETSAPKAAGKEEALPNESSGRRGSNKANMEDVRDKMRADKALSDDAAVPVFLWNDQWKRERKEGISGDGQGHMVPTKVPKGWDTALDGFWELGVCFWRHHLRQCFSGWFRRRNEVWRGL